MNLKHHILGEIVVAAAAVIFATPILFLNNWINKIPNQIAIFVLLVVLVIIGYYSVFKTNKLYDMVKYFENDRPNFQFFNVAVKFLGAIALFCAIKLWLSILNPT